MASRDLLLSHQDVTDKCKISLMIARFSIRHAASADQQLMVCIYDCSVRECKFSEFVSFMQFTILFAAATCYMCALWGIYIAIYYCYIIIIIVASLSEPHIDELNVRNLYNS